MRTTRSDRGVAACVPAVLAGAAAAPGLPGGAGAEWTGRLPGAALALAAVLALAGVVLALAYRARERRRAAREARRAVDELLRMAVDDPDLGACWGPVPGPGGLRARRQRLYTAMVVSRWADAFAAGALPEERLRAAAGEMFRGEAGHAGWPRIRETSAVTGGGRRGRRFVEVLDEVHRATPPPLPPVTAGRRRRAAGRSAWGALLGAAGGIAVGALAATAAARRAGRASVVTAAAARAGRRPRRGGGHGAGRAAR